MVELPRTYAADGSALVRPAPSSSVVARPWRFAPRAAPTLISSLRTLLVKSHQEQFGAGEEPVIGFQLTHSGRFCKPVARDRPAPRVAYRHPLLDRRFGVHSDQQVLNDGEVEQLVEQYIRAARIAWNAGADFVDIKHCHGYLLHEFLSAFRRPGKYGGSFENRTRILREIVAGIRADSNSIDLAVRLSAFDTVPFKPDPSLSKPGRPGPGIPEEYEQYLPYDFGFGLNRNNPLEPDFTEPGLLIRLCVDLGIKIVNLRAGSPQRWVSAARGPADWRRSSNAGCASA